MASAGNDVIAGGLGDDTLVGGPGGTRSPIARRPAVFVCASAARRLGKDTMSSRDSRMRSDRLTTTRSLERPTRTGSPGGGGRDVILGGDGHDRIDARDRSPYDRLNGGGETDVCIADPGDWPARCSHPLVRSHDRRAPILMYHVIAEPGPTTPNIDLWVSPSTFAAQMHWLAAHATTSSRSRRSTTTGTEHRSPGSQSSSPSTTASTATTRRRCRSLPSTDGREP